MIQKPDRRSIILVRNRRTESCSFGCHTAAFLSLLFPLMSTVSPVFPLLSSILYFVNDLLSFFALMRTTFFLLSSIFSVNESMPPVFQIPVSFAISFCLTRPFFGQLALHLFPVVHLSSYSNYDDQVLGTNVVRFGC